MIKIETNFDEDVAESYSMNFNVETQEKKPISMTSEGFQSIEDLDMYIEQQIMKAEYGSKCQICNKSFRFKAHTKEHIEIHIDGLAFDCNMCGRTKRTRRALRTHKCPQKF